MTKSSLENLTIKLLNTFLKTEGLFKAYRAYQLPLWQRNCHLTGNIKHTHCIESQLRFQFIAKEHFTSVDIMLTIPDNHE